MSRIPLSEGRRIFGDDPCAYASARPEYPDGLYRRLVERCGLGVGTEAFEVGAGTGLATRRLLEVGATLYAIEPNPKFATFLRQSISSRVLQLEETPFEDVDLRQARFDLGVAATSFHWVEQSTGLMKAHRALKPGGWWAMWWTHFGAGEEYDAFQAATNHLFKDTCDGPSQGRVGGPPFALDYDARVNDIVAAEFQDAEVDVWRWTLAYRTARLVDLYRTFSPILALRDRERERFLCDLASIADEQFGGCVERPFITVLYTART